MPGRDTAWPAGTPCWIDYGAADVAGAKAFYGELLGWTWTGGDEELPDRDRTVDLDGRLVTPAFVDAHVHLALTGFGAMGVDLTETRSATEALDLLAVHARSTGLGVVLGHSWDETRWAGGTMFTRHELDRAVAVRAVYLALRGHDPA